ncbi:PHB de-polymerase domain-containing protein [mine drainage metagenome]|uniref:PHB de-polymerase domain-containing protein n=1 Tax=mine drainage metagenome TaxID=410659 RepID=T0ZEJ2_9ZZZZ
MTSVAIVNLVGLCQGGWMAAMLAARFPDKIASLVLAGSPIDTHAGNGPLVKMVKESPMSFYGNWCKAAAD